ncbi:hypothetical protein [Vreelandella venusta]|uniref:hypothetical protein n=1 Tax=Vreelandella venusta TaxID=44935 RepID=UPI003F66DB46
MKFNYQLNRDGSKNLCCKISECKEYKLSKFTLGGEKLYVLYHKGSELDSGSGAGKLIKRAERHKGAA